MRSLLALMTVLAVASCNGVDPAADGAETEADTTDAARPASFGERLLFLGGSSQAPRAAVFDFAATVDSAAVQRSGRIWSITGEEWRPLLDTAWTSEPMRDPWRLIPHGPVRLIVDGEGGLDALLYHAEDEPIDLRLHDALAEWSSGSNTQLQLRRAELAGADVPVQGVLMDLRVGYERRSPADAASAPTEAYLTDGRGAFIVLLDDPDGPRRHLWLSRGGQQDQWNGARLRVAGVSPAASADADSAAAEADPAAPDAPTDTAGAGTDPAGAREAAGEPEAWSITVPEHPVEGELQRVAATPGASAASGLFTVRGWLEIEGQRRPVYGVVRHGRE